MFLKGRLKGMVNKKRAIILDAVVLESCNLHCDYCREGILFNKDEIAQTEERVKKALTIREILDFDIFKISGYGEASLFEDIQRISDLVMDKRFMIITNGTRLTKQLVDKLTSHPDPVLCVSVDGHTEKMNRRRHLSQSQVNEVFKGMSYAVQRGIPIEINSVLSPDNVDSFGQYMRFLEDRIGKVMIFPFPVRKFPFMKNQDYAISLAQIKRLAENLSGPVAPPRAYVDGLVEFVANKGRTNQCVAPSFVVGIDNQGDILCCPCGPSDKIGRIGTDDDETLSRRLASNNFGKWSECRNCYNHHEVINCYTLGKISDEEMARVPSMSKPIILDHLSEMRRNRLHG
jgi:MoaA/NifB/PqqE/SkfB family radical SAM enzyme